MEVFEIPAHKNELQVDKNYSRETIISDLQEARKHVRNGPGFILEHSEAYFSIIYHNEKVTPEMLQMAFEDLNRAMKMLNENLPLIITNLKEADDEDDNSTKIHYMNIIKTLTYCYVQIIRNQEDKNQEDQSNQIRRKGKNVLINNKCFNINRRDVIKNLNNLIGNEIQILWDPPIVDESLINLILEVVYTFLQNPAIKQEKEALNEIWSFLGDLIKSYGHGRVFIMRIVQLLKLHEHLSHLLAGCFKFLIDNYQCKSMIHDIVQELTEWQTDENFNDSQGAKHCSLVLVEMAVCIPELMIPEIEDLLDGMENAIPGLRISILSITTEVVLKVFTKHDLTEEERESRDDLLEILKERIHDSSALVRAKVFQQWERLQKETAIPLSMHHEILKRAIEHLHDVSPVARKSAASLVTTFLTHNPYGCELKLEQCSKEMEELEKILQTNNPLQVKWEKLEKEIREIAKKDFEEEPEINTEVDLEESGDVCEILRECLKSKDYKKAVKVARTAETLVEEWKEMGDALGIEGKVNMTLLQLKNIFMESHKEQNNEYRSEQEKYEFLSDALKFLKLIQDSMDIMKEMLETTNISDFHEAINFFVTAHKFKVDRCSEGIIAMLSIMQRHEQDRHDAIINTFKKIYLETDATDLKEHARTIVTRLVEFLNDIPTNNSVDLQKIISDWAKSRVLDNNVIDCLWEHFTQKTSSNEQYQVSSLELLRMASIQRPTIINKNIKLIAEVAFERKNGKIQENMKLVGVACKALAVCGKDPVDNNANKAPFRIKDEDDIFKSLIEIFAENFTKPVDYYSFAIPNAVNCIYKLCSRPDFLCEELIRKIRSNLIESNTNKMTDFQLVRLCQLLGSIAINHLNYMDNTLYKELKRRQNIRENRKNEKKQQDKKKTQSKKRESVINQIVDELTLDGENAEDSDAELILGVLENDTVTGSGLLAKFAFIIRTVCQKPEVYDNTIVQGAAITALLRFMLVSSKFCLDNIKLVFTIFKNTNCVDVKSNILFHFSDLLTRFPNIVEPWMGRVHQSLNDKRAEIRKATFFTLSNLILRDMIRVHGNIAAMAKCMIDIDQDLVMMCKVFFKELSRKENDLYNILPDVFSHLVQEIKSEDLRMIMKFLFDLMDKQKFMPNLVERFCIKYTNEENNEHCRNITYCLTLVNYNQKALKKLQENFKIYKHLLHDEEIYANFKQILSNCNKQQIGKNDMKGTIQELEQSIESVFELREGNEAPLTRPKLKNKPNNGKKRLNSTKKTKVTKKGRGNKSESSSSDDE